MIYHQYPRKSSLDMTLNEDEGFYLEGKDCHDCIEQLKDWCKNHPNKWVYYYDMGVKPANYSAIARNLFEVCFFDSEPIPMMFLWTPFQEGSKMV